MSSIDRPIRPTSAFLNARPRSMPVSRPSMLVSHLSRALCLPARKNGPPCAGS